MSAPDQDLVVGRHVIPADELDWTFGPSGGPGGQHANRANTRAELRFDLGRSEVFPPGDRDHMLARLGPRANNGVIAVTVDESRSQWRNRSIARARLADLLAEASKRPTIRRPTRRTRASQQERLDVKRARSRIKKHRRPPETE